METTGKRGFLPVKNKYKATLLLLRRLFNFRNLFANLNVMRKLLLPRGYFYKRLNMCGSKLFEQKESK